MDDMQLQRLIAARIKQAREDEKRTQGEVARFLHKSQSWLAMIENGHNAMGTVDLLRLAGLLNRRPDWFLLGPEYPGESSMPKELWEWERAYPRETDRASAHFHLDQAFMWREREMRHPTEELATIG